MSDYQVSAIECIRNTATHSTCYKISIIFQWNAIVILNSIYINYNINRFNISITLSISFKYYLRLYHTF